MKLDVKKLAGRAKETVKNIDVKKATSTLQTVSANTVQKVKEGTEKISLPIKKKTEKIEEGFISYKDSLKVIYYMMYTDREVTREEATKFVELGKEMDPEFINYAKELIKECSETARAADKNDFLNDIVLAALFVIRGSKASSENGISGKLLVWNLINVAYGDGDPGEEEDKFINKCAREYNIDESILSEMKLDVYTTLKLQEEKEWFKNSDLQYKVINDSLAEIDRRIENIKASAYALLND